MKIRITKRTDTLFPENCPEVGSVHEVIDIAKGINGDIAKIKYRKVHISILPGEYEVIKEEEAGPLLARFPKGKGAGGKRIMTVKESRALAVAINSLRFNPDLSDIEVQSHEIALANMRDREQEIEDTGLTPEEIKTLKSSEWIYRSFNAPSCEFEQTIGEVEKALGFRLFAWQKNYIAYGQFRQMGVTTAEILKDLLDVSGKPIDHSKCATSERERFYRRKLSEIKAKLDSAGILTRTVFFSERDKRAYKQKEEINRGV